MQRTPASPNPLALCSVLMEFSKRSLEDAAKRAAAKALGVLPDNATGRLAGAPLEIDGYVLDPRIQLALKAASRDQSISDMTPVDARTATRSAFALSNAPRVPGVTVSPTIINDPSNGDLNARVYTPDAPAEGPRPGVLFLHQGGFVIGDLDTCDTFCTQLAAGLDAVVVSLDYLLCPEHLFPTQIENVDSAWEWLVDSTGHLGIDPDQLVVCGDSAGGQLAASLCQRLRDKGSPMPTAQALIYPWLDATASGGSMESCADVRPLTSDVVEFFLSHVERDYLDVADPVLSPALHPNLSDLPPAIVITAGFDVLRDQGRSYGRALALASVPVIERCETSMCHSFVSLGGLSPAATEACERIVADIATILSDSAED